MASSGPIEVDMALNASGVARGADDAKRALQNLGDAFDDLNDAGPSMLLDESLEDATDAAHDTERAIDRLGDSVDTNARSAKTDLDRLEDSMRDVQRRTEDTRRSMDDIGGVSDRSLGRLSDKGSEVAGELRQNLGETFASFRGDLEDLPQIAQDTLGGLAGSGALGGIAGVAAAAAGAAGLGLITTALQSQQEEADKLRERIAAAYQGAAEAGREYINQVDVIAEATDLAFNKDRADEWKQLRADAVRLGVDENTIIAANIGSQEELETVMQRVRDAYEDRSNWTEVEYNGTKTLNSEVSQMVGRWFAVEQAQKAVADQSSSLGAITDRALRTMINEADEATVQVDELGNKLYTLPDGKQILINAETGQATENLETFKGDLDETGRKVVNPTVRVVADTSAWDNWNPAAKTVYLRAVATGADNVAERLLGRQPLG